MRKRLVIWTLAASSAGLALLLAVAFLVLRPGHLREAVRAGLAKHTNLDVEIGELSLALWPRPRVNGAHLTLRLPRRPDLPPLVSIDTFWVDVGPLSALRKHVETLHVDGLRIVVPPSSAFDALPDKAGGGAGDGEDDVVTGVIVDRLVTHDAELTFVPGKPDDSPLRFLIHELTVRDVGFGRAMPYDTRLTNPIPRGLVTAHGSIGPWNKRDASLTPLDGEYTFTDAQLATINGIGGTLASTGRFLGRLTAIDARGHADVPDFSLDLGGKPAHLAADFETTVDGTDGSTTLRRVDATLAQTSMHVTGAIDNLEGPGRHEVALDVKIDDGRIEDLLALAIDAPKPSMTGDVTIDMHLRLPPGQTRVRDRLELGGRFGLAQTRFTDLDVQAKLRELSRRGQGKDKDEAMGRVLTDLRGRFTLARGRMTFAQLGFHVPGATVALDGTYALAGGAMNLHGTLTMQASVSQAVGGFKSIFIRPFDRLFRRNGAGAVVPISITGTRDAPKFGVEMGKVFRRR